MLWQFAGSRLSLLAAVHILDASGPALTNAMERAYGDATRVVFETDLDSTPDPAMLVLPSGGHLGDIIQDPLWSTLQQRWIEAGLPRPDLDRLPPWLAAMRFMLRYGEQLGFTAASGVDRRLWLRCAEDHKSRHVLETMADALKAFADTPVNEQIDMLVRCANPAMAKPELASMITGWRESDPDVFIGIRDQRLSMCPVGFEGLLMGRNRSWLPALLEMVRDDVPTLVVVGALHCFGDDSLRALMTDAGFPAIQVRG